MDSEWGWGLLGPGYRLSQRRTRTLGLSPAVEAFNELAAPGLGNVWFGKQLFLALLGLKAAEMVQSFASAKQITKILTANAVEALACLYAIKSDEKDEGKIRGRTILGRKTEVPKFVRAVKRDYYVSNPMRMSTSHPLAALELVKGNGENFNSFTLSPLGEKFVEACLGDSRKVVMDRLKDWIRGGNLPTFDSQKKLDKEFKEALRPDFELAKYGARLLLRDCLEKNGPERDRKRRMALFKLAGRPRPIGKRPPDTEMGADEWFALVETSWEHQRLPGIDDDHWKDIYFGSRFFLARDAALEALNSVERQMGPGENPIPLADAVKQGDTPAHLGRFRKLALEFLEKYQSPNPEAKTFCELGRKNDIAVLRELVRRDGRCLELSADKQEVWPGYLFRAPEPGEEYVEEDEEGDEEEDGEEYEEEDGEEYGEEDDEEDEVDGDDDGEDTQRLPGISPRVGNAILLRKDLAKSLGEKI